MVGEVLQVLLWVFQVPPSLGQKGTVPGQSQHSLSIPDEPEGTGLSLLFTEFATDCKIRSSVLLYCMNIWRDEAEVA